MAPQVMDIDEQAERRRTGRHFFGLSLPPIIPTPRILDRSRHLAALFLSAF
jgi:hypothetical protein